MKVRLFNLFIIVTIILTVVIPNSTLTVNAVTSANKVDIEEKIYSQATLEDDFSDNRILIVMNHDV